MKKKLGLIIPLVALIIATVVAVTLPVSAASKVTESDFLTAPDKELTLGVDYDYSFAIVGDTQTLNIQDAKGGTKNMEKIYEWIVKNKTEKNISYVMGLGDITDTFKSSGEYYTAEWNNAKNALGILDANDIPYSLVRGNHDISSGLNATFGQGSEYYNDLMALAGKNDSEGRPMGGFLEEYTDSTKTAYKIENTYRKINAGTDKYLIFTLDWAPSDEAINWLNEVISAHPDYKVIATIHQFLSNDSCFADDIDATLPHEQIGDSNWGEAAGSGGTVLPRALWERSLSLHKNVEMVLCGHVDVDDIKRTQLRGNEGNTVTFMLIDAQTVDKEFAPVGMVAMLYFKESGEVVNVEYISTIRDLDGDASTGAYLKAMNQFSMKLEYEDGWTKTPYGYVPTEEYNKYTFLLIADDDRNTKNDNFYLGGNTRWIESTSKGALVDVKTFFNYGGLDARKQKDVYVYMTKSYDGTSDTNLNSICDIPGGVILDLGGNTFTAAKRIYDAYVRTSDRVPRLSIINGNIDMTTSTQIIALQSNEAGNGGLIEVYLDSLTVTLPSSGVSVITSYAGSTLSNAEIDVQVTNCTFNTKNSTKTVNIFNLVETNNNNDATVTVKGSSVIGKNGSNPAIAALGDGDAIVFDKYNDSYLTFSVPHGSSAPTASGLYNTDGEELEYVPKSEGGELDVYQLVPKGTAIPGSLGKIDVWLIGGQSNASGYAIDTPTAAASDSRFENGFSNVLYYGKADDNVFDSFVPVKIGQGNQPGRVGAEIGIASQLSGSGNMNAVIKLGRGSAYLYPDTGNNVSKTYGTWTSPSYIAENGISTDGTMIGALYLDFLATVEEGLALLERDGYIPVIRGMWWMQGEAETWREALANEYDELLTAFINDIRNDLSGISGSDLSNMPFVFGSIGHNDAKDASGNYLYDQPPYVSYVVDAQLSVAASVNAAYVVSTDGLVRRDAWHFVADAQQYLGEEFVRTVQAADGKYSVSYKGSNVTVEGVGSYLEGDTVTLGFTATGKYLINRVTYTIGSGDAVEITLTDGKYSFVMPPYPVLISVETYDPGAVSTKYGIIPSDFANAEDYPFAAFKNGEFFKAYQKWNDLLQDGYNLIDVNSPKVEKATVLQRRSYSTSEDSGSSQNLYLMEGELTIDLGGFVLERGSKHLFQVMAKKQSAVKTSPTINIINGTIKATNSSPFVINTNSNENTLACKFIFNISDVTFSFASGSAVADLVFVTYTNGAVATEVEATFDSCTFDLDGVSGKTIFNLKEGSGPDKPARVTVTNSTFKVSDASANTIYKTAESDKVLFGSGNIFALPIGSEAPASTFTDTNDVSYNLIPSGSDNNKYDLYALTIIDTKAVVTKYGIIPGDYSDPSVYPFAFFRGGKFIEAYTGWNAMLARGYAMFSDSDGREGTLLVRADYSTDSETSSSQNLYAIRGNLTIDLDNHTLTRGSKHLFQVMAKYSNIADKTVATVLTVKNGTILAKGSTPLVINTNDNAGFNDTFYFTFENVTFGLTAGSTVADLVFVTYTNGSYNTGVVAEFTDCTFDLTNASKATTLFNLKEASGSLKTAAITLYGCTVKTPDPSYFKLHVLGTNDSVTLERGTDGKYLKLLLPTGVAKPTATFPVTGAGYAYSFGNPVTTDDGVLYMLCPAELDMMKLKGSVTLYSDFVYNVYIPVLSGISSIKVNGSPVSIRSLRAREIEGASYYVLPIDVSASKACENIDLNINLSYGDDVFSGKWSISVVNYAERALAGEATEVTKTMLRDMLSYIRASYEYFATVGSVSTKAAEIAKERIDSIIGADYDEANLPDMAETPSLDPDGLDRATISLGAEISFVFYPTMDAEKYVFTMGNSTLKSEIKAGGTYIVVTTYAYGVRDTIEYTVEGTDIAGSYNLSAYYSYMASEGNGSPELLSLIERLFKYSESAELYRNEVRA